MNFLDIDTIPSLAVTGLEATWIGRRSGRTCDAEVLKLV
jgi:hypothetical protein